MVLCAAMGCSNRTDKCKHISDNMKISFHQFPKDIELRKKWVRAVRRENWTPSERTALCSIHFTEDCFNRTLNITRLRDDALPTIFPEFPLYLHKLPQEERVDNKLLSIPVKLVEVSCIVPEPQPSTSLSINYHNQDLKIEDVTCTPQRQTKSRSTSVSPTCEHRYESPRIVQMRNTFESTIVQYRKKIKVLQQVKRRHRKRIANMHAVLKSLRARNLLLEESVASLSNISGANTEKLKRRVAKTTGT